MRRTCCQAFARLLVESRLLRGCKGWTGVNCWAAASAAEKAPSQRRAAASLPCALRAQGAMHDWNCGEADNQQGRVSRRYRFMGLISYYRNCGDRLQKKGRPEGTRISTKTPQAKGVSSLTVIIIRQLSGPGGRPRTGTARRIRPFGVYGLWTR